MNVLLHVCCAPCSVTCIETLRGDGHAVTGLWYNPNIHPFTEYRARRDAMVDYATRVALPLRLTGEYGLRPFLDAVGQDAARRCAVCYRCRLGQTARQAKEGGFDGFTTTLLVSPYQNRDLMLDIAAAAAQEHGVAFLPYDFRPTFRRGQAEARESGLYMQKYCGCIFSEEERYLQRK